MKTKIIVLVLFISSSLIAQIRPSYKVNKKIITKNKISNMCSAVDFIIPPSQTYNAVVILPDITWKVGQRIKFAFIDVNNQPKKKSLRDKVKSKIKKYAQEWEKYANIDFVYTTNSSSADIRIGLDSTDGWWSKIGTDAKNFSNKTMNYGWSENDIENDNISEKRYRRTIIHEFGHALGLKHEHQNPSGGICWDWDAAIEYYEDNGGWDEEKTRGNLEILSSTNIGNSTTYDPKSIMHYVIDQSITSCNYEVKVNFEFSTWDKMGISNLYPKSGIRHTLGPYIYGYGWTSGWNNVETFEEKGKSYLFLLKSKTGDIHINLINDNGSIGKKIYDKKWSLGWTTTKIFNKGIQKYLFLLKKSTGDVHIHKINSNGTIGKRIYDKKWTAGWTNAQIFNTRAGKSFLFLIKERTGDVHIHKINSDGTIGNRVFDKKWSSGWSIAETFQTNFQDYLFLLKSSTGDVHIHKLNTNGTVGIKVYDKKWATGWTITKFYGANNQSYIFLLKEKNGHIKQNFITASGTVGDNIFDNKAHNSGRDWTTAEFYRILTNKGYNNYILFLKEKYGIVHINKIYTN